MSSGWAPLQASVGEGHPMNSFLIVEDDPLVRSTLQEMLAQELPDLSVLLAARVLLGLGA
jgi:hypothetical protein